MLSAYLTASGGGVSEENKTDDMQTERDSVGAGSQEAGLGSKGIFDLPTLKTFLRSLEMCLSA